MLICNKGNRQHEYQQSGENYNHLRHGNVTKEVHEEAVTVDDIRSAIRASGIADLEDVGAVIFEVDGKLSVIKRSKDGSYPVLQGMKDDASSRMKAARSPGSQEGKHHILFDRAPEPSEVGE